MQSCLVCCLRLQQFVKKTQNTGEVLQVGVGNFTQSVSVEIEAFRTSTL